LGGLVRGRTARRERAAEDVRPLLNQSLIKFSLAHLEVRV
jgi:hypothetical protein